MSDNAKERLFSIPWYMNDARFAQGTVADIGFIRLTLQKTDREKNNKWKLYMEIRVFEEHGVSRSTLKRGVTVAEFDGELTLSDVQDKAEEYFNEFLIGIIGSSAKNKR